MLIWLEFYSTLLRQILITKHGKKYLCDAIQTKFDFHNNKTFLYSLKTSTSPLSLFPAQVKLALWVLSMTIIYRDYVTFQREFPRRTPGPTALRGSNRYIKDFLIVFLCLYILVPFLDVFLGIHRIYIPKKRVDLKPY